MDGEVITAGQSSKTKTSLGVIHILVVDDDSTSLAITAALLRAMKYEVLTVKHPVDALFTLRTKASSIDLVVTDVHMPGMNGFELQKQIDKEFKLPVVMISADDKESCMLRGLEGGAVFFILKPINCDDLKNIWQYAVAARKGKSIFIEEETGSVQKVALAKRIPIEDRESVSSVNEERERKRDYKGKSPRKGNGDRELEGKKKSKTPKKAKVIWTAMLHNRFLFAIGMIGIERSVPKKILEFMNVPGLTRENIASHLQKYRIFLKQVMKATNGDSINSSGGAIGSNFTLGQSSLMANNRREEYLPSLEQLQMRTTFQPRFGMNMPVSNAPSLGPIRLRNDHEASTSNFITQYGYRQTHLLNRASQANVQQSLMSSNTNHLHQTNCSSFRMEPNNIQTDLSSHGDISSGFMNGTNILMNGTNGLMNATNTMPMYQQQTQASHELFTSGPSNYNFVTNGVHASLNGFQPISSFNYTNNNYAGFQLTSGGELVCSTPMGLISNSDRAANGVNGSYGLMIEQMEGGDFGCGVSSSLGFDSANQFSPTLTNVIQEENALEQPPPPPPQQQITFGNEGEINHVFGTINNTSTFTYNISPSQPFRGDDLGNILFNPIGDKSPNQQRGEEVMGHEFCDDLYQSDDYFPTFDQYPNQQEGGEEFVNSDLDLW